MQGKGIYDLDMDKHSAKPEHISFDREEAKNLSYGFHKSTQWMPYCCFEDVFNPLGSFLDGDINGPAFDKEKQIEAYRSVNASPAGDCGEKVFKIIKRKIQQDI